MSFKSTIWKIIGIILVVILCLYVLVFRQLKTVGSIEDIFNRYKFGFKTLTIFNTEQRRNYSFSSQSTNLSAMNQIVFEQELSSITVSEFINVSLRYSRKSLKNFLSSHQTDGLIKNLEIKNLTSESAKQQFICCTLYTLAKRKGNPPDHIVLPKSIQNCKKMSFRNSGTPAVLVSYPSSGNTWTRLLLEAATGIYTGSVFCDRNFVYSGMFGEGITTENVLVSKTHFFVQKTSSHFKKAIYLIRNPLKAIFAEYTRKYLSSGKHTKEFPPEYYGMYILYVHRTIATFDNYRLVHWHVATCINYVSRQ